MDSLHVFQLFIWKAVFIVRVNQLSEVLDTEVAKRALSILFKQFTYGSSGGNGIYMPMSNHGVHRAVPVEKALENESRKLDWEELSEIVEKNGNGSFCAVKCICRIPWRLAPASPVCTGVCLSVIWQITAFAKASGSN